MRGIPLSATVFLVGVGAAQVALTTGGITKLLDRMVDADLVTRVPCPTDRRVAFAALTPRGERTLEQASAVHTRDLRQVFDGFDCGWTTHTDPDKANGTVRTIEAAAEAPISHPRCRRAFGPRPDVATV